MRQRKSWYGRTDIGQRLPFVALNRHGEGERSPPPDKDKGWQSIRSVESPRWK